MLFSTIFNRFEKFYQLQDHLNERMRTPMYSVLRSNLITFFKTILTLEEFDETIILKTAAILDTNAFEVRTSDGCSKVRAIYAETAMMSHDCVPNSYHSFDENMQITIRAASKYTLNSLSSDCSSLFVLSLSLLLLLLILFRSHYNESNMNDLMHLQKEVSKKQTDKKNYFTKMHTISS